MSINPNLRPGMIEFSAPVPLSWKDKRDKTLLPLRRYKKDIAERDEDRTV